MQNQGDDASGLAVSSGPVVVVVDGTYAAGEALLWAARFSKESGREIIAARPFHAGLGELGGASAAASRSARLDELAAWTQLAGREEVTPRLMLLDGEPPANIDQLNALERASLVVYGTESAGPGRSPDDALLHRLTNIMDRPLAIIPAGGASRILRDLIVGVDGSVRSIAACAWVAAEARHHDWRIHVVTAYEPFLQWLPANDPRSLWDARHRQMAGPWTKPLRTAGVRFTYDVVEGIDPVTVLTNVARNRHADALVVGSRRGTGRHQRRRGTAAIHLAAHSHLPVIFVPSA